MWNGRQVERNDDGMRNEIRSDNKLWNEGIRDSKVMELIENLS